MQHLATEEPFIRQSQQPNPTAPLTSERATTLEMATPTAPAEPVEALASEQPVECDMAQVRKPTPKVQPEITTEQPVVKGSSSSWLHWGSALLIGLLLLLTLGMYSAAQSIYQAWLLSAPIGGALALLLLVFIGLVGFLSFREIQSYRRITKIDYQQTAYERIQTSQDKQAWLAFYQSNQQAQDSLAARVAHHQFFSKIKPHHTLDQLQDLYRDQVTQPLKTLARKEVKKQMLASAAISGLSPNAFYQTLALLWLHLSMVRRVAQIYGLRPGLIGQLRLAKMAFNAMVILSLTDMASDTLMSELFGQGVLAKVSAQSAEAMVSARLTYRLGEGLMDVLWIEKKHSEKAS